VVLLRLYVFARETRWCRFGVRQFLVLALHHYSIRYGIDISRDARIGSGFYIGHFGGIFVNADVVIGANCNISQGVTLGRQNRGEREGCPTIGNDVYIAPGAKIIGRIMGEAREEDIRSRIEWLRNGRQGNVPEALTKRY